MSFWNQASWRPDPHVNPLSGGARGDGFRRGKVGIADFIAGTYPACSLHGAMNAVGGDKWRCLVEGCNAGAEATQ